jgi:hypothetical protein
MGHCGDLDGREEQAIGMLWSGSSYVWVGIRAGFLPRLWRVMSTELPALLYTGELIHIDRGSSLLMGIADLFTLSGVVGPYDSNGTDVKRVFLRKPTSTILNATQMSI